MKLKALAQPIKAKSSLGNVTKPGKSSTKTWQPEEGQTGHHGGDWSNKDSVYAAPNPTPIDSTYTVKL